MISRLDVQISKLEDKHQIIHGDSLMIQGRTEKLCSVDSDFNKHHFTIIELVDEDQETVERVQALLDDHVDEMTYMMDRLIPLPIVMAPSMSL